MPKNKTTPTRVRAYECTVKGTDWRTTVHAETAGKPATNTGWTSAIHGLT